MEIRSFSHLDTLNQYVGAKLLAEFKQHTQSIHFLPTGNTYLGCYKVLIDLIEKDESLDFSELVLVNLDEYVEEGYPLNLNDTRSFAYYMQPIIKVLQKRGFRPENHLFPYSKNDQTPFTPFQQLTKFDKWLQQKECECASVFLGLGPKKSPHLAFCSPGYTHNFKQSWQDIGAYVGPVDQATRNANTANYGMDKEKNVPYWSCTISSGTLWKIAPKKVYLVAYGDNKDISVINGFSDVGTNPASVLPILERRGTSVEIITIK